MSRLLADWDGNRVPQAKSMRRNLIKMLNRSCFGQDLPVVCISSLKVGSCCMEVMQGSLAHSNTDWGECLHKAEVETSSTISSKLVKIGHGVQPSAFAMVTPSTVNVYLKCTGACSFQQQRQARPEKLADWKSFRLDFFFPSHISPSNGLFVQDDLRKWAT